MSWRNTLSLCTLTIRQFTSVRRDTLSIEKKAAYKIGVVYKLFIVFFWPTMRIVEIVNTLGVLAYALSSSS